MGRSRRRETSAELRAHLEDLADELRGAGHPDGAIQEIVGRRFGEPREIAREFAEVYRAERVAAYAGAVLVMLVASLAAVGLAISTLQLFIPTASHGSAASAFSGMRYEAIGFVALTWGYCGIYFAERFFQKHRLACAAAVNLIAFAAAAAALDALAPGHVAIATVAFLCAATARILQRTNMRFAWFVGTAVPLSLAWGRIGPLINSGNNLASWQMACLVWLGMTLACWAMTSLAELFERAVFPRLDPHHGN
ncbi:MAG: hypothetical protein WCA00_04635 [Candidatus Acidiferrales bacterium]